MNLTELQAEVYASGAAYLQQETGGPARVTRWINQAYQELCDLDDWPFLETTATGTAPLTITDFDAVESVLDTSNRRKLEEIDWPTITELYPDLTTAGTPRWYYLTTGNVVNVYPVQAVTLSVRYYKNPTDLSGSSDTPVVPAQFHDIIVLGAWRRVLLDDNAAGDYQFVKQEWLDRVQTMRQALLWQPTYQVLVAGSEDD